MEEHGAPKRDDVRNAWVHAPGIESDNEDARRDGDTHLRDHVSHRAAVRHEIATANGRDAAHDAEGDDRAGEEKAQGDG